LLLLLTIHLSFILLTQAKQPHSVAPGCDEGVAAAAAVAVPLDRRPAPQRQSQPPRQQPHERCRAALAGRGPRERGKRKERRKQHQQQQRSRKSRAGQLQALLCYQQYIQGTDELGLSFIFVGIVLTNLLSLICSCPGDGLRVPGAGRARAAETDEPQWLRAGQRRGQPHAPPAHLHRGGARHRLPQRKCREATLLFC